MSTLQS